jgi:hypothetical protein
MDFKKTHFLIPIALVLLAAFSGDSIYILYRNSPVPIDNASLQRIHVATFDAKDGEAYNMGNCQIAEELFQKQSGVTVKYWCGKG